MPPKKKITEASDSDIQSLESIIDINVLIEKLENRKVEIAEILEDNTLSEIEELISSKGLDPSILQKLIPSTTTTSNRKQRTDAGKVQPLYWRCPDDHSISQGRRGRKSVALLAAIEKHGEDACKIENQD